MKQIKEASSVELFRELLSREDVLSFRAGLYRDYDIQPKYGVKPVTEDNSPVYAIAMREDAFSDTADSSKRLEAKNEPAQ